MAAITLGADPEFAIMNMSGGGLVRPDSVIRDGGLNSQFGIDGSQRVAELRPTAKTTPEALVKEIKRVMQEGVNISPLSWGYRWKAGGVAEEEPIGGHIHFGHGAFRSGDTAQRVSDVLNRTLAPIALMAEDREEAVMRRVGSNYGSLRGENCWRAQPWGMEYRVLSSWLTSPEDALSVLTLAHLIAKNFDNESFMDAALELPEVDNDFFVDCNKRVLTFYLEDIAKVLKKAEGYRAALGDMRHMFSLIISGKSFDTSIDMKVAWGLTQPANVPVSV